MANIYVKQQNYMEAIKLYQKALDQIPNTFKELKMKIMENIGLVFVRIGQYPKAIIYFEDIMSQSPNTKTGYNLVLCYYAIGDKERMKKGFQKLISVPLGFDEDKYIPSNVSGSGSLVQILNICSDVKKTPKPVSYESDLSIFKFSYQTFVFPSEVRNSNLVENLVYVEL